MNKFFLGSWLLLLLLVVPAVAQDVAVTGSVTSSDDSSPLPGVSVQIKGTTRGTTTDARGSFQINVPSNGRLVFSYIGYTPQEIDVNRRTSVDVSLAPGANDLAEAVVVAYGSQKRTSIVGAITSIEPRALQNIPFANLGNQLQGFAPGVQAINSNGRPGAPAFIRIRGIGSINAGSDPLYVVDGVPLTADAYQAIPVQAISSISILKDASSVAIYGSRGSNGVILVTTRRPNANEGPRVDVNLRYGLSERTPDNYSLMNTDQKLQYEYDLGYANSYVAEFLKTKGIASITAATPADLASIWDKLRAQSVDWTKLLVRQGAQHTENISLSGGSEKISYFAGIQNYYEDGINIGSSYRRQTGTMSLEFRPYKWLRAGQTINASVRNETLLRDRNNAQSPFRAYYTYNPYEPEFNTDGGYNLTHQGFSISEAILNNPESTRTFNGLGTTYVGISPIEGMEITSRIGINYIDYARESYIKPNSVLDQYVGDPNARGSKTDNGSSNFNYVWTNTAQYAFNINKIHDFTLLGGTEFTKNSFKSYTFTSKGFPSPNVNTQDNASTPVSASSSKSDWALYSLFGRLNYVLNRKYLLEASVRRDGSSRFGVNNRYGTFWAVGAGWNVSQEAFLANSKVINSLRTRLSIGTSGNFNIGNYQSLGLYRFSSYGITSAATPSQLANPDLTWERSMNYNLGLDFAMFKNRLRGTVDLYSRDTKDLLLNEPLSGAVGFSSRLNNIGSINNRGLELSLGYDIVKSDRFTWNLGGNITLNRNRVVKLYNGKEIPNGVTRYVEGQPLDVFFLNRSAGVNPDNGAAQYLDKDGAVTTAFSSGDAVILPGKSPDPRYFGSVTNTITYRGLTLSAQVYYSGGNYILNYMWSTLNSDGANRASQQAVDALNYWKKAGDVVPNPKPTNVSRTTDRFLQKGDYIRLRNVTLAYELPRALTNKIKMRQVDVFIQGQNLLYYAPDYKGDPEVGIGSAENGDQANRGGVFSLFTFPTTRSYTAGLNIRF